MRVCPVCKQSYDDDVDTCPNDGEALIEGGESLPDNPDLASVVEVDPDEATAMVDLEKLSPVIAERLGEREERLAAERDAEDEARKKAEAAADPENTGTLYSPDASKLGEAPDDEPFDEGAEHTALQPSPTDGPTGFDKNAPTQRVARAPDKKPKGKGCLVVGILMAGVLVAGGVGGGLYYLYGPQSGEVLTVTTTPPGAQVTVDGKGIGESPVQLRVKAGSHTVELELEGYEPFKEIVDVKAGEGLPFLQPLKAIKGFKPKAAPTADGGLAEPVVDEQAATIDALVASVEKHLEADDLERALADVKELLKQAPDDQRTDDLFDKVTQARALALEPSDRNGRRGKRRGRRRGSGGNDNSGDGDTAEPDVEGPDDDRIVGLSKIPKGERKSRSRKAYQAGERFFRQGRLSDAKREFKTSVQLDPRFALPHRSVARIYQREGNDKRASYHLKRYLKLGGPDPDHRVRDWLEKQGSR